MEIVFSRSGSLLSRLIQKVSGGHWSHNAIKIDEHHVIDSRFPRGVQIRHFDFTDYEIIEVEGDEQKAHEHLEKHYDLLKFIWYGIRYGDSIWNNPSKMICSELVASCVTKKEYEVMRDMTPNEQYAYFKNKS